MLNVRILSAGRPLRAPFVLLLATVSAGCQQPQTTAPAAAPTVSEDVWAVVDGRSIRRDDVEKMYRRTLQPNQLISQDEATTAKLNLLDQVITQDLLLAKARELNIVPTEAEVETAFADLKKHIPDEMFKQELEERSLTETDMREATRRDLTAQKVIEREVTSKIAISDQDIDSFFQANKAQFNLPEAAFHLQQIVITPTRDESLNNRSGDDAADIPSATAKLKMLMERLKSNESFSELAMDFSEEAQSAPRGGDLGLVLMSQLGQASPELRETIFKMQPGDVETVTVGGAHLIVKLLGKQAAGQRDPSMPEVRRTIVDTLQGDREQLMRAAYVEAVRGKATVVNYLAPRIVESQGRLPSAPGASK
jgi:parvulin-like peptidyl-prolyl isomerase